MIHRSPLQKMAAPSPKIISLVIVLHWIERVWKACHMSGDKPVISPQAFLPCSLLLRLGGLGFSLQRCPGFASTIVCLQSEPGPTCHHGEAR